MIKVAALVPAFNEASSIAEVVSGIRRHIADVFVVDDGSTDRTAICAGEAGGADHQRRVV